MVNKKFKRSIKKKPLHRYTVIGTQHGLGFFNPLTTTQYGHRDRKQYETTEDHNWYDFGGRIIAVEWIGVPPDMRDDIAGNLSEINEVSALVSLAHRNGYDEGAW